MVAMLELLKQLHSYPIGLKKRQSPAFWCLSTPVWKESGIQVHTACMHLYEVQSEKYKDVFKNRLHNKDFKNQLKHTACKEHQGRRKFKNKPAKSEILT